MKENLFIAAIACCQDGELYNSLFADDDADKVLKSVNAYFDEETDEGHGNSAYPFVSFSALDGEDFYDEFDDRHYRIVTYVKQIEI